jgi:hypothetical protein
MLWTGLGVQEAANIPQSRASEQLLSICCLLGDLLIFFFPKGSGKEMTQMVSFSIPHQRLVERLCEPQSDSSSQGSSWNQLVGWGEPAVVGVALPRLFSWVTVSKKRSFPTFTHAP